MATIMAAMTGSGGGQAKHLAGLAMANAVNTGAAPDRGYDRDRGHDRDRRFFSLEEEISGEKG